MTKVYTIILERCKGLENLSFWQKLNSFFCIKRVGSTGHWTCHYDLVRLHLLQKTYWLNSTLGCRLGSTTECKHRVHVVPAQIMQLLECGGAGTFGSITVDR